MRVLEEIPLEACAREGNTEKAFCKTKIRDRMRPLKKEETSMIDSAEEMSEAWNRYLLTVFTKQRLDNVHDGEQLLRGEQPERLIDISTIKRICK